MTHSHSSLFPLSPDQSQAIWSFSQFDNSEPLSIWNQMPFFFLLEINRLWRHLTITSSRLVTITPHRGICLLRLLPSKHWKIQQGIHFDRKLKSSIGPGGCKQRAKWVLWITWAEFLWELSWHDANLAIGLTTSARLVNRKWMSQMVTLHSSRDSVAQKLMIECSQQGSLMGSNGGTDSK